MRRFSGRKIEVKLDGDPPAPAEVVDGERVWQVREVVREWFDIGHGSLPARAQTWRTRRHRKNFLLETADGSRLLIYLDYARDDRRVWHLVTVEEPER
ncbi:MAG: hypothetical protein GX444_03710 [Myxococcales bacterium]|nr:hypothetical protein [Myxococcales bacterium]